MGNVVIVDKVIYYRMGNRYFKKTDGNTPEKIGKKDYEIARIKARRAEQCMHNVAHVQD